MNGWGQTARGLWFLIKALASLFIVEQGKDEGGGRRGGGEAAFVLGSLQGPGDQLPGHGATRDSE